MKERHVLEALGKIYVVIENGRVVEVGEPLIERCPIFLKAGGIEKITKEIVKQNIEFRIQDFGMCTGDGVIEMDVFVGFGASEVMMTGLRRGIIDASVSVCEVAGTVITISPTLTQGIGARISGVLETTLIPRLKDRIEEKGGFLLDRMRAVINQPLGVARAVEMGFKRVAATVATLQDALQCRDVERNTGADIRVIGVQVTGMEKETAQNFLEAVDITTGCASRVIREAVEPKASLQVGTSVPLFALSQKGRELLLERAKDVTTPILVNTMKLPVLPEERQPSPLT
jgi:putative methanogenesis marker protein 8